MVQVSFLTCRQWAKWLILGRCVTGFSGLRYLNTYLSSFTTYWSVRSTYHALWCVWFPSNPSSLAVRRSVDTYHLLCTECRWMPWFSSLIAHQIRCTIASFISWMLAAIGLRILESSFLDPCPWKGPIQSPLVARTSQWRMWALYILGS